MTAGERNRGTLGGRTPGGRPRPRRVAGKRAGQRPSHRGGRNPGYGRAGRDVSRRSYRTGEPAIGQDTIT